MTSWGSVVGVGDDFLRKFQSSKNIKAQYVLSFIQIRSPVFGMKLQFWILPEHKLLPSKLVLNIAPDTNTDS